MKIRFCKLLCLLLAFLMLITLPVSCKDGEGDETLTHGETEQKDDPDRIAIVSKGTPKYVIVYGKGINDACRKMVDRLQTEILEATGATVEVREEGDAPDPAANEIVIGSSKYDETAAVSKKIKKDQYAIMLEGNKIVVVAKSHQLVEEAIWCFIERLIPNNLKQVGSGYSLYYQEFLVDYEEPEEPLFNGESLSMYSVVYSKAVPGMEDLAMTLTQRIKNTLGFDLECYPDTFKEEREFEILVGPTNRAYSTACFADGNVPLMYYRLTVDGSKIQFVAAGAYSMDELLSKFVSGYIMGISRRNLRNGVYMEKDLMPLRSQPLTEGSTLRVMTSNILADVWEDGRGYPSVAHRAEMYAAILSVYAPDLVGVQETDKPWIQYLPYYLDYLKQNFALDYGWIENSFKKSNGQSVPNYTSLIYRKDSFTLVDSGSQEFSFTNSKNYKIRVATWAVLTHKQSNEQYALINTHFSFTFAEAEKSVAEECALIESLKTKYKGLHVFCTGDFNNHLNSAFGLFKDTSGLTDSKEAAEGNGSLINQNPGIPEGIYIDHVLYDAAHFRVTRHETLDAPFTDKLSDHKLQYGDYVLLKGR